MVVRSLALFTVVTAAAAAQTPSLAAQQITELPGEDRVLDVTFEEVFRVGALEGESWETLGTVRSVAFDERGNLHVFDGAGGTYGPWRDPRVLVFDTNGAFVREFGRSGQGPGEFNNPVTLAVLRDGTVAVSDVGHRAYQLFDAEGEFTRMVRVELLVLQTLLATAIRADPRGQGVFLALPGDGPRLGGHTGAAGTSRPIVRIAHGAGTVDGQNQGRVRGTAGGRPRREGRLGQWRQRRQRHRHDTCQAWRQSRRGESVIQHEPGAELLPRNPRPPQPVHDLGRPDLGCSAAARSRTPTGPSMS